MCMLFPKHVWKAYHLHQVRSKPDKQINKSVGNLWNTHQKKTSTRWWNITKLSSPRHAKHPQETQRKFLNSIIVIFPDRNHTKTSLVKSKVIWMSITVFQCASWRWPWEMHLNCLKKIIEASKLVKGHLNNSDQSTFVYDAMSSGCSAVTLITLMLITFGKHAVTSSSTIAGIFPSLTMKL